MRRVGNKVLIKWGIKQDILGKLKEFVPYLDLKTDANKVKVKKPTKYRYNCSIEAKLASWIYIFTV